MNTRFIVVALLVCISSLITFPASAQKNQTIAHIEEAFQNHQIDRQTKVLYQLYAGLEPSKLPQRYQSANQQTGVIKCGTPFIMDYRQHQNEFSAFAKSEINRITGAPVTQDEQQFQSASGRFVIYYSTSGGDAVPAGDANANSVPDYVEWTAAAADSSWREEVQTLGFNNPVTGSTDPYPVFIEDLGADGYYGFTSTGTNRDYDNSTYIVINSQFDQPGFQYNDDLNPEQGAIKVTIAHELKHAIQYANSEWYTIPGDETGPNSYDWTEMDATLMEEIVYDNVNDYYNYIRESSSVLLNPAHTVPVAYGGVTWMIYFAQDFGIQFWVDVWAHIRQRYETAPSSSDYLTMTGAISTTLDESYHTAFAAAFARSHLWHFACGSANSPSDFGFDEREDYPVPTINSELTGRDSINVARNIPPLSAKYIQVNASSASIAGSALVTVNSTGSSGGLGLIAYFNDGHTDFQTFPGAKNGSLTGLTSWEWDDIQRLGIVVTNSSTSQSINFTLIVDSDIPKKIMLEQNYPNPFSQETTIPLSIPNDAHVKVTIFDVMGRKVRTLVDEDRSAGHNPIAFDASELASGIYFVRVIVDGKVLVEKLTVIK